MAIVGPIALYNNFPINADFYQPRVFFVSNITLGVTTTVTTTEDHDFVIGQQCRLIIPPENGCRQLNEMQGLVILIPVNNEVVLGIYSVGFDPFQTSTALTQPQIVPIGGVNSGQINANGRFFQSTFIPGSFINISPGNIV